MKVISLKFPSYSLSKIEKIYQYSSQIEEFFKKNPKKAKIYVNKFRSNPEVSSLISRKQVRLIKGKVLKNKSGNFIPLDKDDIKILENGVVFKDIFLPRRIYNHSNLSIQMVSLEKNKTSYYLKLFLK